jgi:dolichol-phosphate mannosyltransferase
MTSAIRQVPTYRADELSGRRNRYALCLFVINEGDRLLAQLGRMQPWMSQVDVVVADGGSTDGSTETGRLARLGVNCLLTKTGPGKLGAQMRMAFAWCLDRGYEGVIVMDGNNKDGPEAIDRFIAALDSGVDHAQGSRFIRGGRAINTPPARYWGVRLLHAPLLSAASRYWYTDTTNGFRAYSQRLLVDPQIDLFRAVLAGYELHYYLAMQAARRGYVVREVPTTRAYPAHGPTPSKIHGLSGNLRILKTLWDVCTGKYSPCPPATANDTAEISDAPIQQRHAA